MSPMTQMTGTKKTKLFLSPGFSFAHRQGHEAERELLFALPGLAKALSWTERAV